MHAEACDNARDAVEAALAHRIETLQKLMDSNRQVRVTFEQLPPTPTRLELLKRTDASYTHLVEGLAVTRNKLTEVSR